MLISAPEFKTVFFEWAVKEAARELDNDFPLLRTIDSRTTRKLVSFINELTPTDRSALIDYSVSKAFGFRGVVNASHIFDRAVRAILELSREDQLFSTKINKQSLRRTVLLKLEQELGTPAEKFSPTEVIFHKQINQFDVSTIIDFGGKSQMRYGHKIATEKGFHIAEFIDIHAWMGFGHTKWTEINDVGRGSESIAKLCMAFLTAVPKMLQLI